VLAMCLKWPSRFKIPPNAHRQNVAKWCEFEAGKSDVRDEIRSGRPPLSLMKSSEKLMKTFVLTDV
jgi:hypothetical protein